jgi:hypothetical protein
MRADRYLPLAAAALLLVGNAFGQSSRARPISPAYSLRLSSSPATLPSRLAAATNPLKRTVATPDAAKTFVASIALADIGFKNGIRLANLGARHEIYVPLPENPDLKVTDLTLHYDDLTAFKARRHLEVLVNDRTVAAVPLTGSGSNRTMRIPLDGAVSHDGFLKISFLYSGAASPDRCIDVRYVGDSLTIRPQTAIDFAFNAASMNDVAAIAALMPRQVSVLLPERTLSASEMAAALTVARALTATGRHADFRTGSEIESAQADADGQLRWSLGTIVIGTPVTGAIPGDSAPPSGTLSAIRVGGMPALLLTDVTTSMRAARLLATPSLAAARGMAQVNIAAVAKPPLPTDRVTFAQLGLHPAPVDVYGRAELKTTLDTRNLPVNTQPARLALNVLVAPDGAGDKAVVSLFVNGHLLASTVAASDGPTHLDQSLPEGLVGTVSNIDVVVQRRSAAGDCRFEPQGYPAQILDSSAVILSPAGTPHDFSDLATRWSDGVEVLVPPDVARHPQCDLALLSDVLSALSPPLAPVKVAFAQAGFAPSEPFISVSAAPPGGATPHVHFDRGRVVVKDPSGRTLLDLGGFKHGAVAQLIEADGHPGIWIKGLASDGELPAPASLKLDRGDVAFLDNAGIAFAMSTLRDTLVLITYPDQTSWATISERFGSWIIGGLWLLATVVFLFALQRLLRRRPRTSDE